MIEERRAEDYVVIGIEIPESLHSTLKLDYNIGHEGVSPACIVAAGFQKLSYRNLIVILKPDLDTLMSVAILKKMAYREPLTEEELHKIDLIARQDVDMPIRIEEHAIIGKLITAIQDVKFYERWKVIYDWLVGDLKIDDFRTTFKDVRQVLLERYDNVLVVVSFGLGAFMRKFIQTYDTVIALNPNATFLQGKGRRYCIGSKDSLSKIQHELNKVDEGWGGHRNIICSSPKGPCSLELHQIVELVKRCNGESKTEELSGESITSGQMD